MTATYKVVPRPAPNRWWLVDVIVDHPSGRQDLVDALLPDDLERLEAFLQELGCRRVAP